MRGNVRLYKGWFEETLPPFLQQQKEEREQQQDEGEEGQQLRVGFVHMDCDIYSSTKYTLVRQWLFILCVHLWCACVRARARAVCVRFIALHSVGPFRFVRVVACVRVCCTPTNAFRYTLMTLCMQEILSPLFCKGTVIVFDEWWGYEGWEEHEAKAWAEYEAAHPGLRYNWINLGYGEKEMNLCPSRALVISSPPALLSAAVG